VKSWTAPIRTTPSEIQSRQGSQPKVWQAMIGPAMGPAAAILTRADLARSYRDDPVLVKGVTVFAGPNPQKDPGNDFLGWKATVHAAG